MKAIIVLALIVACVSAFGFRGPRNLRDISKAELIKVLTPMMKALNVTENYTAVFACLQDNHMRFWSEASRHLQRAKWEKQQDVEREFSMFMRAPTETFEALQSCASSEQLKKIAEALRDKTEDREWMSSHVQTYFTPLVAQLKQYVLEWTAKNYTVAGTYMGNVTNWFFFTTAELNY